MKMNEHIKRAQSLRFNILNKVYELASGSTNDFINGGELAEQVGITDDDDGIQEYIDAVSFLEGEGLLKINRIRGGFPAFVQLSHNGIVEIETAISKPDESTEHFPAINILNVGTMIGSAVQQGSHYSTLTMTVTGECLEKIKSFASEVQRNLDSLNLATKLKEEAQADINTLISQTNSPKPKPNILRECLESLRTILEGAAGGALGAGLVTQIPTLLALLAASS